ncbi:MAG: hypothetical protein ABIQ31_22400 [Ferruginibacter sp.]
MKIKTGYLLVAISIFFVSCNTPRYMYSPSAHNVPVLVKQGDSKLAANYSTDLSDDPLTGNSSSGYQRKSHGFDLQGAVAITDHFAIQANYFNRSERNRDSESSYDSADIRYKRHLTEIGFGYLKSMHRRDKVMFQLFAGVGKGSFSFIDNGKDINNVFYTKNHRADVLKVYVQPAFLFRPRENFSLAISTRISFINFRNIQTDYMPDELRDYRLDDLEGGYRTFWEPAFTNTFGFNKLPGVKFEYQFGTSVQMSDRRSIDYRGFNFSLGILLDIPKMFKPARDKN